MPTYLITGGSRGIGRQLLSQLLSRPLTTVVCCNRNLNSPQSQSLYSIPTAPGSSLLLLQLDASVPTDAAYAYAALNIFHPDVAHIDVLIANSGTLTNFGPVLDTSPETIRSHIETNTLGPLALIQAFYPMLKRSPQTPKFLVISSYIGSMGMMAEVPFPALAYGISKASINYIVRKLHFENEALTVFSIHPGWVKTDMGVFAAEQIGLTADDVPLTVEDSVTGVLKVLDSATRETAGGRFFGWDGKEIPW